MIGEKNKKDVNNKDFFPFSFKRLYWIS